MAIRDNDAPDAPASVKPRRLVAVLGIIGLAALAIGLAVAGEAGAPPEPAPNLPTVQRDSRLSAPSPGRLPPAAPTSS